jgi:hypothetical protein
VFDFVADERNEPRFNPKMLTVEKVTSVSKLSNMEIEGTLRFDPVPEGTRMR